jgi:hypothetical protein
VFVPAPQRACSAPGRSVLSIAPVHLGTGG